MQACGRSLQSVKIPDSGHAVCARKSDMQMQQAGNDYDNTGQNDSPCGLL